MHDIRGVPVSQASAKSLETYETALSAINRYRGDPVAIIDEALAEDQDFVMGHVFRAEAHLTMWERSVLPAIDDSLARLGDLAGRANDRERRHIQAVTRWAAGDWDGARGEFDRLSALYPRDMLALQVGHLCDFYHGDRDNLRGRIARALPAWHRDDRGYGFVLGMQAFGLEECADYGAAEETGRHAIDLEPEDCWAQHAVAHVLEMQARQAEGIAFMEGRAEHWSQEDNGFAFHNWWHTALYYLDQGEPQQALAFYDKRIRPEPSEIQLTMVDAVALLWRLHLQDVDVGGRWNELADLYENGGEAGYYAFNDMHAALAYAATGREQALAALLRAVSATAGETGSNAAMTRAVGLPIVQAIAAFGRGRYAEAVDLLMPVRYRAHAFGGSHAQRDILHRTLIAATLRAGDKALAQALTAERTAQKPHCPFSWRLRRQAEAA